jgi:hypothetical protein
LEEEKLRKYFFFEKKKQKTFANASCVSFKRANLAPPLPRNELGQKMGEPLPAPP